MPRAPRIDAPGLTQHVIARGVERRQIFIDDDDYRYFLSKLRDVLIETDTDCYAWVLMPNHIHLLTKTGSRPLGNIMKRLLGGYATYFNLKHKRVGHLFQNRYKSIVVQEDSYLTTLIVYIHLNPFRAGLVKDIHELPGYRWSGHGALTGKAKYNFQDTKFVFDFFGGRQAYLKHVQLAAGFKDRDLEGYLSGSLGMNGAQEVPEHQRGFFDRRIFGTTEFAQDILGLENERQKPAQALLSRSFEAVCENFDVDTEALRGNSREQRISLARGVFASLAKSLGFSGAEIARELEKTEAAVVKAVARGNRQSQVVLELRDQLISKGS